MPSAPNVSWSTSTTEISRASAIPTPTSPASAATAAAMRSAMVVTSMACCAVAPSTATVATLNAGASPKSRRAAADTFGMSAAPWSVRTRRIQPANVPMLSRVCS